MRTLLIVKERSPELETLPLTQCSLGNSRSDSGFPDTPLPVPGAFFTRPMRSKESNTTEPPFHVGNETTSLPLVHRELDGFTPSLLDTSDFLKQKVMF